jgi:hypothetical protein
MGCCKNVNHNKLHRAIISLCLHFLIYENAAFVKGKPSAFPFASAGAETAPAALQDGEGRKQSHDDSRPYPSTVQD